MLENPKNEVEFRRNMYLLDLILAREARREKLYISPISNLKPPVQFKTPPCCGGSGKRGGFKFVCGVKHKGI